MAEGLIQERGIKRGRTRTQRIIVLIVVAALLVILAVAWLSLRPRPDELTLAAWTWARVERRTLQQTLQVSGTMDVERQEDIVSLQTGTLSSLGVAIGERVHAGQVLARIDSKTLQDQLAQSESTLEKTRRDLAKLALENRYTLAAAERGRPALVRAVADAAQEVQDAQRLLDANAGTAHDLKAAQDRAAAAHEALDRADADRDHAAALYELSRRNMEADIALMGAAVTRLKESLDECTVRAPFDGTVMDSYAQVGSFITQYQKLFHLADTAHPRVILDVPEDSVVELKKAQPVTILSGSGRYAGTIERIGLEAQTDSSGTSTVPVYVTLSDPPSSVIPGSSATGEIVLGVKAGALILPRGAYLSTGSEHVVYRIQGERAVRTEVIYGVIQANEVEVVSGLAEGDRIITSGYQDFIDRPSIRLRPQGTTHAPADAGAGGKSQ